MSKKIPNTGDVLNAAADYLQQFGWRQMSNGQDGGPRCMVGSIFSVWDGIDESNHTLFSHVFKYMGDWLVYHGYDYSATVYNDKYKMSAERVVATLMEMAADWKLENE